MSRLFSSMICLFGEIPVRSDAFENFYFCSLSEIWFRSVITFRKAILLRKARMRAFLKLKAFSKGLQQQESSADRKFLAVLVCTGNNFMHSHPHPLWFTAGGPRQRNIKMRDWNVNARITEIPHKKIFFCSFRSRQEYFDGKQRIVIPNDCR